MKRTQRHHLKQNELARTLAALRDGFEQHRSRIALVVVVVLLVVAGAAGITMWRQQTDAQAQALLAEAMVILNAPVIPPTADPDRPGELPAAATLGAEGSYASEAAKLRDALPKLEAAARAYPNTDAGITARYHYASALAALGRPDEAIQAFEQVIVDAGANSLYGRMSRLGKADTQMRAGQIDASIATWQDLAESTDDTLPKDAILMELGRAYAVRGDQDQARTTFARIVDEYPMSPYTPEARAEMGIVN